jgi:hypothetical protein
VAENGRGIQPLGESEGAVVALFGVRPGADVDIRHAQVRQHPGRRVMVADGVIVRQRRAVSRNGAFHVASDVRQRPQILVDHRDQVRLVECRGIGAGLLIESFRPFQ